MKDEWFSDDLRKLEDDNVYRKMVVAPADAKLTDKLNLEATAIEASGAAPRNSSSGTALPHARAAA